MSNENIIYLKKELGKINNLFKQKNFFLVIKKSKILLKKNSNQPIVHNFIGLSYIELGENEKAIETFLLAQKKLPSDSSICCNTGIAYKQLGDLVKAREYFYKALNVQN